MQEYTSTPHATSRTLDTPSRPARQAPLPELLQAYPSRAMTPLPREVHANVTQRAVKATSSPKLTKIYNDLLKEPTFAHLDSIVSVPPNELTLIESTAPSFGADYNPRTHTIRVNTTGKSAPLIADDILWEMHNAKSKSAFDTANADIQTGRTSVPLSSNATANAELYTACSALANEWIEWTKLLEHVARTEMINKSKPTAVVKNTYKGCFSGGDPDQPLQYGTGWFLFENYLKDQIAAGHTAVYDPLASNPKWRGYFILQKALLSYPQLFTITETQSKMFLIGQLQAMDVSKNIFTTQFLQGLAERFSGLPEFK